MTEKQGASAPAANAPATPDAAAAPADRPSLDQLLKEFDTAAAAPPAAAPKPAIAPAPQTPSADAKPAIDPERFARVETAVNQQQARDERQEIVRIVESVQGQSDFLKSVDSDLIEGFLNRQGFKDPRFREAFLQRGRQPDKWNAILRAAGAELEAKLKPLEKSTTANSRAAVLAAARTQPAPKRQGEKSNEEIADMTDAEFKRYKASRRGRAA